MKKILLGLVAAACLASFAVPAFAGEEGGGDAPKAEKKGKKKAKKGEGDAGGGEAGGEKK